MEEKQRQAPGATPFAQRLLVTLILVGLLALLWRLSDLLVVSFGAIVLAVALRSLATLMHGRLHIPERWSVLAGVLLVATALCAIGWLVGEPLAEQLAKLRERLPFASRAVLGWMHANRVGQLALQVWQDTTSDGVPWARLAGVAGLTLGLLGNAALIIVMGMYLAAAPNMYRKGFVRLMPLPYRKPIDSAMVESAEALRRWLLGQSLSMAFVGCATALGLWALGISLPLAVGVISGLLAFIPFFGAIAGGLLAVLLAFMEGPQAALYVALLCVGIQQIEGHLLMPMVQKWAVQLPPVLSILSAVVFGALFGIVGVLFATPMMVVAMTIVRTLYVDNFLEHGHVYAAPEVRR
ncbi:AI-2E family transporter [Cupriavidus neocaledonicus]|nr:AI-2E family transporter [Cupriavidus neocaledonicus]SOZ38431.1 conserved membrane hypothetical protein [Cupriavidus neocaledonicus]